MLLFDRELFLRMFSARAVPRLNLLWVLVKTKHEGVDRI